MKIIASNNAFVYDELAAPGFQLVKPQTVVVSSGDEALAAVRAHAPELAILDAEMPGLDGYAVCERIKADPATRLTRVILALQGTISAKQLQRLAACGCDDVVVFRLPGEDLYRHVARLLGLPDPSHGEPVELEVSISYQGEKVGGRALQLADTGAALVVPGAVPVGTKIRLGLRRHAEPDWLEVGGEVIDVERTSSAPSTIARVVFHDVAEDVRKRLADLAFWDAKQLPTGQHIRFRGSFDEGSDFTRVKKALGKEVVFDLSGIRAINSWGVRHWIMFLRAVPADTKYCFVNASVIFVKHCNMVVDMLGKGDVLSFVAPYECGSCGLERDRTLQVSSVTRAIQQDPPEFRCGVCGGVEKFADLPDRYFAFLRDKV